MYTTRKNRNGFTLIEVLIVVTILGILAATVMPQFNVSSDDAHLSVADFNERSLNSALQMYVNQTGQGYPATPAALSTALTGTTVGIDGKTYGPYLVGGIPNNPYTVTNTVTDSDGGLVDAAIAAWWYDATNKVILRNDSAAYAERNPS